MGPGPSGGNMTAAGDDKVDGRVERARILREERRAQILLAARRVFSERGYHSASIQGIIQEAGIARGTFYLYFEGKRAVFEEVLDDLLTQLRGSIRGIELGSDEPPQVQLYNTLNRVLQVLVANQDLTAILLRQAVGLDMEFDTKLAEFYGRILEIIEFSLVMGMELGLVRPLTPSVVSKCILGSVKEVLGAALLDPDETLPDLHTLTRQILDYNLLGVMVASSDANK